MPATQSRPTSKMGDALEIFWYRYKVLLLAAGLLVVAAAGWLLQGNLSGAGGGSESPLLAGKIETVFEDNTTMSRCLENSGGYTDERVSCLRSLEAAWPLATAAEGLLLPGGAWYSNEQADPVPLVKERMRAFVSGDVDNDGYQDLVLSVDGAASGLRVYTRTQDGYVDGSRLRLSGFENVQAPAEMLLYDINSDGWLDLVTRTEGSGVRGSIKLYMNRGWELPGAFDTVNTPWSEAVDTQMRSVPVSQGSVGISAIRVLDIDRDRRPDLVTVSLNGVLTVLWGSEGGFEKEPTSLPVPVGVLDMETVDIDNDGKLDLILAADIKGAGRAVDGVCPFNRPCDRGRGLVTGGAVVLRGDGKRSFTLADDLTVDGIAYTTSLETTDVDMDGWLELFIGREIHEGSPSGLDSRGVLAYAPVRAAGKLTGFERVRSSDFDRIPAVQYIGSADVDGDGDIDLLLSGRTETKLFYWENRAKQGASVMVSVRGAADLDLPGTNRDGIGTRLELSNKGTLIHREIGVGGGRGENVDHQVYVGLGGGVAGAERVTAHFPVANTKDAERKVELDVAAGNETLIEQPRTPRP